MLDIFYYFDIEIPSIGSITDAYLKDIAHKINKLTPIQQNRFNSDPTVNTLYFNLLHSGLSFNELKNHFINYINQIQKQHDTAENYYNEARNLRKEQKYDKALESVNKALELYPPNRYPLNRKYSKEKDAILNEKDGEIKQRINNLYVQAVNFRLTDKLNKALDKINEAIEICSEISRLQEDNKKCLAEKDLIENAIIDKHLGQAQKLRGEKNFDKALEKINKAINKCSDDPKFREKKNLCLAEKNLIISEKDEYLRQAADMYYRQAQELRKQNKYNEAINSINEALRIYPNSPKIIDEKNLIEQEKNEYVRRQTAENLYHQALNLHNQKKFDDALFRINQALSYYPNDLTYLNEKSYIEKDKEKARLEFADNKYIQAQELRKHKNYDAALNCINEALALYPNKQTYNYEKDRIEREKVEENRHKTAESYYTQAINLQIQEDYDNALKYIEEALGLFPFNPDYVKAKAYIEKKRDAKRCQLAEELYRQALNSQNQNYYKEALAKISEACLLQPDNEIYKERKDIIVDEFEKLRRLAKKKALTLLKRTLIGIGGTLAALIIVIASQCCVQAKLQKYADNLCNQAEKLCDNNDYDRAFVDVVQALSIYPDNKGYQEVKNTIIQKGADYYYDEARNQLDKQDFLNALTSIGKAVDRFSDNADYLRLKNEIESKKELAERRSKAQEYCKNAQKLRLGKKFADADKEIDKAILLFPDDDIYKKEKENIEKQKEFTAKEHYKNAQNLRKNGTLNDLSNALLEINEALALYPTEPNYVEEEKLITAETHYNKAISFRDNVKLKAAYDEINKALNLYPNDEKYIKESNNIITMQKNKIADEHYKNAQYNRAKGEYVAALAEIKEALKLFPEEEKYKNEEKIINNNIEEAKRRDEANQHNNKANQLLKEGKYKEAKDENDLALKQYPNDGNYKETEGKLREIANSYYIEARNLRLQNQLGAALDEIKKALNLYSEDINYQKELEDINKAVEANKRATADAYYQKAQELRGKKQFVTAEVEINKALALYPNDNNYRNELDDIHKAAEENKREIANAYYEKAQELRKQNKLAEALVEINKALALYPKDFNYSNEEKWIKAEEHYYKAKDYFSRGELFNAENELNIADSLYQYDPKYNKLQEQINKERNFQSNYDNANKANASGKNNKSYKDINEAYIAINNALIFNPQSDKGKSLKAEICYNYANILLQIIAGNEEETNEAYLQKINDYEKAIQKINESLVIDSSNVTYKKLKADICYKYANFLRRNMHNYDKAASMIDTAISLVNVNSSLYIKYKAEKTLIEKAKNDSTGDTSKDKAAKEETSDNKSDAGNTSDNTEENIHDDTF